MPLDREYPADRLAYMLDNSAARLVVAESGSIDAVPATGINTILIDECDVDAVSKHAPGSLPKVSADSTAYLIYTSGSTGKPKGVIMPHSVLCNLILWQARQPRFAGSARTLQFTPLSFDVHFQEFFGTWITGGTLVLISEDLRVNAMELLKFLHSQRIERLFLPFVALQSLSEVVSRAGDSGFIPGFLRDVVTAGEQLQITSQVAAFFQGMPECVLHNHYGPSETHVVTAYTLQGSPDHWPALPPIGSPISNCTVRVLNDSGRPVNTGEEGELYIGGNCVAIGYIGLEVATKEAFVTDPCSESGGTFYRTGDLVKQHPDGNFQFLGRKDGQVKIRGYRVEPAEIEIALCKHPGIAQAVVSLQEMPSGQKTLVAYMKQIASKAGTERPATNTLREYLTGNVPDFMIPGHFLWVDEFPRTPSGKIDRRALPLPEGRRPDLEQQFVSPKGINERRLCTLWRDLLCLDRVGAMDNLFDLGADSLLCVQSVARLKQDFDIDLPVTRIFQEPTVRALAKCLDERRSGNRRTSAAMSRSRRANGETTIAIIGMAGRFPGARNIDELWEVLRSGKETTSFFRENELDSSIDNSVRHDPNYVGARGVLDGAEMFDAPFFGISPLEAKLMDPQHRIFLEVAYEAFNNSGYDPEAYDGTIGVFAGSHNNSYYHSHVKRAPELVQRLGEFQTMVVNEKDYLATRVAHKLNCTGPALSIHTACSTSLVATVAAVESLIMGDCDMALAGGVAVTAPQRVGHLYQEGAMLSKDGHCRPFDAEASGTVFSDGVGAVLLKRFDDARRDRDNILALIRGAAFNNDGSTRMSFSAPSLDGQAKVIAEALSRARVSADSVTYVEAHGTATPLGDPIEIAALTDVFRADSDRNQYCAVGSIKSNFGHLTAASGVAGLIKTVLALQHKQIPPTLHFQRPNPEIDFARSPFFVNKELRAWDRSSTPRRAGVSSFGVGGTNAHVVLEEAPQKRTDESVAARPFEIVPFSARSRTRLESMRHELGDFLRRNGELSLNDVAYTLQQGRKHFRYRQFLVCQDTEDLVRQLSDDSGQGTPVTEVPGTEQAITFLFPGQGSHYPAMGAALYTISPVFAGAVDSCAKGFSEIMGEDIRDWLLDTRSSSAAREDKLEQTLYAQPAIFTIEYALARLWMHWGVEPDVMIGHSIGEYVCACIAGVFSLEDAVRMVAMRATLMQSMPAGSMLSVRMDNESVEQLLDEDVSVASINAPSLCVVSGPEESIARFQRKLERRNVVCSRLHTSHAFHSAMMDPVIERFLKVARISTYSRPELPFISTATGTWIRDDEAQNPQYWASQLRKPVLFSKAAETALKIGPQVLLEVGPRATLGTLVRQQPAAKRQVTYVASSLADKPGPEEWRALVTALGRLWSQGIAIDWKSVLSGRRVPLPAYPFEHERCWIDVEGLSEAEGEPVIQEAKVIEYGEQQMATIDGSRAQKLVTEIQQVLEEVSGMEVVGADSNASFLDIGLDSLTLTQAAIMLTKRFDVGVTFRQLIDDFSNSSALARYLDAQMPAETAPEIQSAPASATQQPVAAAPRMVSPPVGDNAEALQSVIFQQMAIMQRQLDMLSGNAGAAVGTKDRAVNETTREPAKAVSESKDFSVSYGSTAPRRPFGAGVRIRVKDHTELDNQQRQFFDSLLARYAARTAESKRQTQEHRAYFADPRTVSGFSPLVKEFIYPVVINKSLGCRLWDIDGNEYVDMLGGFGSNLFGHRASFIVDAVSEQLDKGYELGPQNPLAGEVAKLVCEMTGMDRATFCNTGSEAVLGTMRLARTVTGRDKIVIFEGAYHGILDEVIVRGGRDLQPMPAAAGVPATAVQNMLVLEYGSPRSLEIVEDRAHEIAGVLVESVQSRRPSFQPRAFLYDLRQLTRNRDIPLIFDECITGFRIHPRGAQGFYDVQADIASYGKVAGGGLPFGIVAGKKRFLDAFDGGFWSYGDTSIPEVGVTYYAGTFSRHPLALAASRAALTRLKEEGPNLQQELNARADAYAAELNRYFESVNAPMNFANCGSMMNLTFTEDEPLGELLYSLLRLKGVFIWDARPSFLTLAHSDEDIQFVVAAFKEAVGEIMDAGLIGTAQIEHAPPGRAHA